MYLLDTVGPRIVQILNCLYYAHYPYRYITDNYLVQLSEFSHQIKPH